VTPEGRAFRNQVTDKAMAVEAKHREWTPLNQRGYAALVEKLMRIPTREEREKDQSGATIHPSQRLDSVPGRVLQGPVLVHSPCSSFTPRSDEKIPLGHRYYVFSLYFIVYFTNFHCFGWFILANRVTII